MVKLRYKYGDMFSCGWLPTVGDIAAEFMTAFMLAPNGFALFVPHKFDDALGRVPVFDEPTGVCAWAGSSEMFSVCVASPPSSPKVILLPTCTGTRPCRFGSANVCLPSPP